MSIERLQKDISEAKAKYQAAAQEKESVWRPLSNRVVALQKDLTAEIASGALECDSCGAPARGLFRYPQTPKGVPQIKLVEIACSKLCRLAVVDQDREKAVAAWNLQYGRRVS
jgi:hypothetical protein